MSITITQDIEARYSPGKSAELNFTIRGAASEAQAGDALANVAPTVFDGLFRKERQIETVFIDAAQPDKNLFKGKVFYGANDTANEFTESFDTTGGSQQITQSLLTVSRTPANAPNFKGALNFDGQKVNGVEIVVPVYTFSEQHYKSRAAVSAAYRKTLANLTGKVNSSAFRGFDAGEVLFRGAAGQLAVVEGVKQWQITYQFAASPNRANIPVGDLVVPSKLGWDYLWALYGEAVDQNAVVQTPIAAYVERVYEFADFSALGI